MPSPIIKKTLKVLLFVLMLLALMLITIKVRYGGGEHFPDLTAEPSLNASVLETVAELDKPPGNIAVSAEGRLFFTFHPEGKPSTNVAEWVNGKAVPYPNADFQVNGSDKLHFQSVLSVRIDRQNRLWTLDLANHGTGQPRLLAFDLSTDKLVHQFDFPNHIAGLGSHMNDFQVSPDGTKIYIADASVFAKNPALVVYDTEKKTARRVLENHFSVTAENFTPVVQGRKMLIAGIFAIRPNVDSIALDKQGEWLYYAPVTNRHMYRVRTKNLLNKNLTAEQLAEKVEIFAAKTMTDGLTMDLEGNIYLSDADDSAILTLDRNGKLHTLIKDPKLRWPDGFSFGPNGWLYVTCSSLHHVIMRSEAHQQSLAPYHIFRFKPGPDSIPGH